MDLFNFSNVVANTVNMTVKYLREAEKINAKLILAVFKTAEQAIATREDLEKTELVEDYLLNLVRLHFATVDIQIHVSEVKRAISTPEGRLSSYLITPEELRQYMKSFEAYSGYMPEMDLERNAHWYYKMLKVQKELNNNVLTYRIDIPIKRRDSETNTFYKIRIRRTPFHLGQKIVKLIQDFPSEVIYNIDKKEHFNYNVCDELMGIYLCKPQIWENSKCLISLVENENWEKNCNFQELDIEEYIEKTFENNFAYMPRLQTELACSCAKEVISHNRITITWKESSYPLNKEINIIQIPTNCECRLGKHRIPRRGQVHGRTNITWHWLDQYNISDISFDIISPIKNRSELLSYIQEVKESFDELARKYTNSRYHKFIIDWAWPLQVSHISFFTVILVTLTVILCVKYKNQRRESNLRARLEGQTLNLNVINLENEA